MEHLNFGFLHPLRVVVPNSISIPNNINENEKPKWEIRGKDNISFNNSKINQ
jgi:hypothetical protein